jgi:hypothetical protein
MSGHPEGNRTLVWTRVLRGAAAGAAGTTALNAVTYLDMTLRGRPPSRTPENTVEALLGRIGLSMPGDDDTRPHRVEGLAALLGAVTGVGVGVVLASVDESLDGSLSRLPVPWGGLGVTTLVMVAANGPMTVLGVTYPRAWTAADWISDLAPHLAYGFTAAFAYTSMSRRVTA